ncbi:hypothetical protein M569_15752 [Genlisea aurea]|uniref:Phospholipid/glycerol acyltransferase domain-containing protein n=1 Tax=Genlisea aurea TaxID=192259 RepID=S8D8N2_9LAMI|nr:hypothetical protein M569_15752 [Genlisea aurea]
MEPVVIAELEGTLLKDPSVFSYFMLIAFEASGIVRFALLLALWPLIRFLEVCGRGDDGIKLSVFVATAGVNSGEVESAAKAVLPKFLYDDVEMESWREFSSYGRRVVVTKMPRVMVERFAKEHLGAEVVVGSEIAVTRFGFFTGFLSGGMDFISGRVSELLEEEIPCFGFGRPENCGDLFLNHCRCRAIDVPRRERRHDVVKPPPVIFHDGRLVKRPTPSTAVLILLWLPFGIVLAIARILLVVILPMKAPPFVADFLGGLVVKGTPPPPPASSGDGDRGFLYVCTHRTLLDPVVLSYVLQRRIPAVTYSLSRLSELLAPIPTIRLTRIRDVDARKIETELRKGDLAVCPEGTTCREPFLLRFSALFAELTDRIVPVAMNYRVTFFHGNTARGWKALDPFFLAMNPRPVYEVTFLNQLPTEATCSGGRTPYEVANHVQRMLGAALGFECTNLTRKDKYRILAGNDGSVPEKKSWNGGGFEHVEKKLQSLVSSWFC